MKRLLIKLFAVALFLTSLVVLAPFPLADLDPGRGGPLLIEDRDGRLLRCVLSRDGRPGRTGWVSLDQIDSHAVLTLLASEDQRFFEHPGVDLTAIVRAVWLNLTTSRTYGASTLTMQLARRLYSQGRPRTLYRKIMEAVIALKLEQRLTKRQILEQYLNRVYYGHGAYGIEAAARVYFSKPASALSAGEASLLSVLPRGPEYYDPVAHLERALTRRDHLFAMLMAQGKLSREQVKRARQQPIDLIFEHPAFRAPHFVDWVISELPESLKQTGGTARTTLESRLQEALEHRVAEHAAAMRDSGVEQAAVVVLDSAGGRVLAMVGSAGFADRDARQINAAARRRYPGSALKPFVYAAAIEAGDHPGSIAYDIADAPSRYQVSGRPPKERGPVRYREALAGSYNLAAIHVLEKVGIERIMEKLRLAGAGELGGDPEKYGLRLALGSTKVRLVDLAAAYGFLVREGKVVPPRAVESIQAHGGAAYRPAPPAERRVFSPEVAWLVMDMLSDPEARRPMFGPELPVDLPYRVAAKTGTAQGFTDAIAIFATREFTVAAWTGRFDGRPTSGVLGMSGAGPLARAGLLLAARGRLLTLPGRPAGVVSGEVCPDSGLLPSPVCPHRKLEYFVAGREPTAVCDWHQNVDGRVVIRYPDAIRAWSKRRLRALGEYRAGL